MDVGGTRVADVAVSGKAVVCPALDVELDWDVGMMTMLLMAEGGAMTG